MPLPDGLPTSTLRFSRYWDAVGSPSLAGLTGRIVPVDPETLLPVSLVHVASNEVVVPDPVEVVLADADPAALVGPLPRQGTGLLSPDNFLWRLEWDYSAPVTPGPRVKVFALPADSPSVVDYNTLGVAAVEPAVYFPVGQGPQGDPGPEGPEGPQGPAADTSALLVKANNLSDLASPATARTNLGLATVAASGAYGDLTGSPINPLMEIKPPVGGAITGTHNNAVSSAPAIGSLVLGMMLLPAATYDAVICRVGTPQAGATVKIVAYDNHPDNGLGALLFETTAVPATAGGYLSVALPSALVVPAPGKVIWIGLVNQGALAAAFWGTSQANGLPRISSNSASFDLGGIQPPSCITVTGVTGAAPASPSPAWSDGNIYKVALRRSA